jgi:hypothetical protein
VVSGQAIARLLSVHHFLFARRLGVLGEEPRVLAHHRRRRVADELELGREPLLFLDELAPAGIGQIALPVVELVVDLLEAETSAFLMKRSVIRSALSLMTSTKPWCTATRCSCPS